MSYVPGFSYDIFVSYAREDNVDGWVEEFNKRLTGAVARAVGRPFSEKTVYFDLERLKICQEYPDELDTGARDSALLVALLSPSYASSHWCNREREMFTERLPIGAVFTECLVATRICPIEALPQSLGHAQHADFVKPGSIGPWPAGSARWNDLINRLAAEITIALRKLRNRAGAVFVGATPKHRMDLRDDLVSYLSEQHFRATPDPVALLDDRTASQTALTQATCAVHFLGGASDAMLESIEDSIQYCTGATVLYESGELSAAEEFLLDGLDPARYPHRVRGNKTELETFLADLLARSRDSPSPACSLALICGLGDFPWARQFQADGLTVGYPRFLQEKVSTAERIRRWKQMLLHSSGLLYYQGRTDEALLERVSRLAKEVRCSAVQRWYLDNPDLEAKIEKRPGDAAFPEGLDQFLNEVRLRVSGGL